MYATTIKLFFNVVQWIKSISEITRHCSHCCCFATEVERLSTDLVQVEKDVAASKSTAAEMMMETKTAWAE